MGIFEVWIINKNFILQFLRKFEEVTKEKIALESAKRDFDAKYQKLQWVNIFS